MPFKPGRLGELWLNGVDVSNYFGTADWAVKMEAQPVDTFKTAGVPTTWHSFIAGLADSTITAAGYYDSADADKVRDTLQAAIGQATYAPAGALAIGDQCRLLNVNSSDFKNGGPLGGAVLMTWAAISTAPVGIGECLHVLQSESLGTITGTGAQLQQGVQTLTGLVAHLHVTAVSSAVASSFKLQDATTLGGTYADITGGAFTNMTAVGSQRLVVPGTIRAFVKCVAVIGPATTTYGVAAART